MGLIPIHNGKTTRTITTTKRSMDWHSQSQFVNLLSLKSWTLKGVILLACHWRLFCTNRPITFGWGSWLMVVSSTSSLQGHRSCCLHDGALDTASNERHRPGQGLPQPGSARWKNDGQDEQHQVCCTANSGHHPQLGPNAHGRSWHPTRKPSCAANWQCCVRKLGKIPVIQPTHRPQVLQHPEHPFRGPFWTSRINRAHQLHPSSSHRVSWFAHLRSILGCPNICQRLWRYVLSTNGSQNCHCLSQKGRFWLTTSPRPKSGGRINQQRPYWNSGTVRCDDGHPREPYGQELRCLEPFEGYDCSHQSDELTSPSISKEAQAQSASIPSCNP